MPTSQTDGFCLVRRIHVRLTQSQLTDMILLLNSRKHFIR